MGYDPDLMARVMEVIKKDLDAQTIAIVNDMMADGHRLAVIRDAFMENRDALAVKMIRDLDPERGMELLPISTQVTIAPGQSAQITARPLRIAFRPRYLLLSKETAEAVDIEDIMIGNRSQFSQSGQVPGEAFAIDVPAAQFDDIQAQADADSDDLAMSHGQNGTRLTPIYKLKVSGATRLPLPLDFETAQTATNVTVTCTNISDKPIRFRGAFVGEVPDHIPNFWSSHPGPWSPHVPPAGLCPLGFAPPTDVADATADEPPVGANEIEAAADGDPPAP